MAAPRCFFVGCKTPVAFSVERLWRTATGELMFPTVLYCCPEHRPGAKAKHPPTVPFYRVEPLKEPHA